MDSPGDNARAVIGGQIFAAALMASLGGNSRQVGQAANYGGLSGINSHVGRVTKRQESVLGNCLAARGYRVLDGTAQVTYTHAIGASARPGIVTLPTGAGNPPPPPVVSGQDSYVAEQLARQLKCNETSLATLVGKGPGYESYSMACTNGETLMMRCEMGNCRVLR